MPIYNPSQPQKVKYLFIDGEALDSLLDRFSKGLFEGIAIEIDYRRMALGYEKIFYYDCLPVKKPNESDTDHQKRLKFKTQLFNQLKSLDRFHVYEGTARYRNKLRGQEQKQVDIMIAVDMLTHSFRRNMHEATLLTGDLDFKPLIDALVQEGMHVSLWYPKGRANYELVDAADSRQALTISTINSWFTDSFKAKATLPDITYPRSIPPEPGILLEKIRQTTYEGLLYEKEGSYFAYIPKENDEYMLFRHDNIEQLKFYIEHVLSPDVFR